MSDKNTIEKIHRFLHGEMDTEELAAFEKEMAEDETLKHDTEMENRLLNGLKLAADTELKNNINAVHQDLKAQGFFKEGKHGAKVINLERRKNLKRLLAVAASVIIVAAAWWFINQQQGPKVNTQQIFAENYKPESQELNNIMESVGFGEQIDSREYRLKEALGQYRDGNYIASLDSLSSLKKDFPDDNEIELYLALSHLETGNSQTAIELLRSLSIADFDLQEDAKWYLGLLLMKNMEGMEDIEEVKDLFFGLTQNGSSKYKDRALKVLQELQIRDQ